MKKFLFLLPLLALIACGGGSNSPLPPAAALDLDTDADGVIDNDDCEPEDAAISPGAKETLADGIDQDCNGTDKYITKATTNLDTDGDGTSNGTSVDTYDPNGNITFNDRQVGAVHSTTSYEFDSNNNLTKRLHDFNGDGTFDSAIIYIYNADGFQTNFITDIGNDGTYDLEELYEYNSAGERTKTSYFDAGTPTRTFTRSFDASSKEIEHITEFLIAPFTIYRTVLSYDASGNNNLEEFFVNGALSGRSTYTYTATGLTASICEDGNADLICNRIRYFSYDADGNMIKNEEDGGSGGDSDGSIDFVAYYVTEELPDGSIKTSNQADDDNNGSIDYIEYAIHDLSDNILETGEDSDADGNPDNYDRYSYNEYNLRTAYSSDSDGDGTPETVYTTEYEYSE